MFNLKKNYASLSSSTNKLYEMSDEDITETHKVLLEIYDDLFTYCEKNSIKMIAGGGTALGAVRHGGFIPWDDDMDLNMMRSDYNKFIDNFEIDLGDKYDLLAPGYKKGASCFLMRVMKKNTTLLNMIDETSPYPTGIYIDITPIDYAPVNKISIFLKGVAADILRFISYSVFWNQYKSPSLKEFMLNSDGKNYYRLRMLVGKLFSFLKAERWFAIFDQFIQGKKSKFITIAAGRKKYRGELYPIKIFFPSKIVSFENRKIYAVNEHDAYLKHMYGNYMEIPSVEQREKHLCIKLDFNKSNKI